MSKRLALVAVTSILAFTAACGGGRPSTGQLSEAIQEESGSSAAITEEIADCLAEKLQESDISDDTLQKVVDGDIDPTGVSAVPKKDEDAIEKFSQDAAECITPAE